MVVKDERTILLRNFQIQTDKLVIPSQMDNYGNQQFMEKVVLIDVAIPSDRNTKTREHNLYFHRVTVSILNSLTVVRYHSSEHTVPL